MVHYIGGQLDTGEVWGSSDRWVQGGGVTASKATVKCRQSWVWVETNARGDL